MNKVIVIGNLTRDPEIKQTNSGKQVCNMSVAVKRPFTKDETDFFSVTAWNQTAELCSKYLHKGNRVGFVGRIQNRTYEKDGQKRTVTDIIADEVEFLTAKNSDAEYKPKFEEISTDGDLPF